MVTQPPSSLEVNLQSQEESLDTASQLGVEVEAPQERFYHPELDGLRFFAFLAVFIFHQWGMLPNSIHESPNFISTIVDCFFSVFIAGAAGVDLFFLLSAYLITRLLMKEQRLQGSVDVKAFYIRRALRIWPLYYVILIWGVFFESAMLGNAGINSELGIYFAAFWGNWAFTQLSVLPDTTAQILWTVSIEEQFYLTWPLLFKCFGRKTLVGASVVLLVFSFVLRMMMIQNDVSYLAISYNTFNRIAPMCLGILMAFWHEKKSVPQLNSVMRKLLVFAGMFIVVLSIYVFYVHTHGLDENVKKWDNLFYTLAATVGCGLIFLGAIQPQENSSRKRGVLSRPSIVFLGRISYGLYMFHMIGNSVSKRFYVGEAWYISVFMQLVIALLITVCLAIASYYLLEKPFLKLKIRFTKIQSRPGG